MIGASAAIVTKDVRSFRVIFSSVRYREVCAFGDRPTVKPESAPPFFTRTPASITPTAFAGAFWCLHWYCLQIGRVPRPSGSLRRDLVALPLHLVHASAAGPSLPPVERFLERHETGRAAQAKDQLCPTLSRRARCCSDRVRRPNVGLFAGPLGTRLAVRAADLPLGAVPAEDVRGQRVLAPSRHHRRETGRRPAGDEIG